MKSTKRTAKSGISDLDVVGWRSTTGETSVRDLPSEKKVLVLPLVLFGGSLSRIGRKYD
jgi:hypothetical protein